MKTKDEQLSIALAFIERIADIDRNERDTDALGRIVIEARSVLREVRMLVYVEESGNLVKCGCGDIRPVSEMCARCGLCCIGCCMCDPESEP